MNHIEEKLHYLLQESQKLTLSNNEKQQVRENVLRFVKSTPAQRPQKAKWSFAFFMPMRMPLLQYAALALIIFMAGTGVSLAAQQALPDDILYPVKTEINEKIMRLVRLSDKAKAEYELGLVKTRLEEIEKVSVANKLNEQSSQKAQALLNGHLDSVKERVKKIKQSSSLDSAIGINSELEASLKAHGNLINRLSAKGQGVPAQHEQYIASEIKKKTDQVRQDRQNDESALFLRPAVQVQVAAEGKLKAAEHLLQTTSAFLQNHQGAVSQTTYVRAEQDLQVSASALADGKARLNAQDYNGAFAVLSSAMRIMEEVRVYVAGEVRLQVRLQADQESNSGVNIGL